jgi:hypothetical protein
MKYILLAMLLISCEKFNSPEYVILTTEGRWICKKQVDDKNYSDCHNKATGETVSGIFSGGSVVLEIVKE